MASFAPATLGPCAISGVTERAIGEYDRAAAGKCRALRTSWHAERVQPVGKQRLAGRFLEKVAEALGAAMRHRESVICHPG